MPEVRSFIVLFGMTGRVSRSNCLLLRKTKDEMKEKHELRRLMKVRLGEYSAEDLARMSARVVERVEGHPLFQEARVVMAYWPMSSEPDVRPLLERWAGRKELLLPVTGEEGLRLKRYEGTGRMRQGKYGIWEPDADEWWDAMEQIDLVIVPGVAFDREGNRLGHGMAYYDRFLRPLAARRMGVCFPFQLLDAVPHDALDCRMDVLLSS